MKTAMKWPLIVILSITITAIAIVLASVSKTVQKPLPFPSDVELAQFRKAVERGDISAVERFLDRRDNDELINHYEEFANEPYALQVAYKHHHLRMVHLLLDRGADVNATDFQGRPLLSVVNRHLAQMLIDHGADVNFVGTSMEQDVPPIIARIQNTGFVRMLIDAGANVNIRDPWDGATPLHAAARDGSVRTMDLLLSHGARVNARDIHSNTPLHLTAGHSDSKCADLLIKHGARKDAVNSDGNTPLHLSIADPDRSVARSLINKGAKVNIRNKAGRTPLLVVAYYDLDEMEEDVLKYEIYDRRLPAVPLLLRHGAHINAQDNDGNTALMLAVLTRVEWQWEHYKGDTAQQELLSDYDEIIDALVSKGADINAHNTRGQTAMAIAKEYNSKEMIAYLQSHGAK